VAFVCQTINTRTPTEKGSCHKNNKKISRLALVNQIAAFLKKIVRFDFLSVTVKNFSLYLFSNKEEAKQHHFLIFNAI